MKKQSYVASPYTYNDKNKPTSWGIWNKELSIWTPSLLTSKKAAEKLADSLNRLGR